MKKRERKKRHYIPIAIAVACLAVLFSLLFFSYIQRMKLTLTEENSSRLSEVSAHVSSYMQLLIEEQLDSLQIAASTLDYVPEKEARLELLSRLSDKMNFEYTGFAGTDGQLYTTAFPQGMDISGEAYFQAAISGNTTITGLTRTLFWDRAVSGVVFAVPAPDGAVVAMADISKLGSEVQVHSFDGLGYSYIIDREGNLILHARSMQYHNYFQFLQNMDFDPGYSIGQLVDDIAAQREGLTAYSELGTDKYAYYRPMGLNGWTVVSTVPKGVITQRTALLTRDLVFICAASMLFFLVLLILICVQFLQLEDRRRANHAKSAFLANMSHDMRTPMNAIMGMTALAESHVTEPETVADCLQKITYTSRHLLGLINDILDMSRIESGKMTLCSEPLSLSQVLENSVSMVYPSIHKKRQHFDVLLKNVKHEYFQGDSLRLAQIIVNLLSNATKFTPENGHITVRIEEFLPGEPGIAGLRLYITDDGIGMQPEFVKMLFTPFTRAKDSKVDKIEGSGLGMSITKRIIELMGGSIQVESERGKGTTFTVMLPMPLAPAPEEAPPSGCRVLVVNPDADRGWETTLSLQRMGLRAELTADSSAVSDDLQQALSSGEGYRIILLDRKAFTPDILSLMERQKTAPPFWVLCAYKWEMLPPEIQKAGFHYTASNPLFPSVLVHCIRELLNGSEEKEEQQPHYDFKGRRILIAEDNELNLEITENLLTESNASVTCTVNGAECVKEYLESEENWFDLILLDIQMPVMNGYEASRQIRASKRRDAALPIIAMSANAFAEDKAAAKEAGMDAYLTKPLDVKVWMETILNALDKA